MEAVHKDAIFRRKLLKQAFLFHTCYFVGSASKNIEANSTDQKKIVGERVSFYVTRPTQIM